MNQMPGQSSSPSLTGKDDVTDIITEVCDE